MLCISEDKAVTRDHLKTIVTPEPTDTWKPIPHYELATAILDKADALGLQLRSEAWGVEDGILYERDGNKVVGKTEIVGARLYGALTFGPASDWPQDMGLSIGVKTANDKSFPAMFPYGASVFLCENGVVSGEHVLKRKHTSGFDVEALVEVMFQRVIEGQSRTLQARKKLEALPIREDEARLLAVKCAQEGAYSSSKILPVLKEWNEPSVPEWKDHPRSAWRFYNSANVICKGNAEGSQTKCLSALSKVLFSLVGMTVAA